MLDIRLWRVCGPFVKMAVPWYIFISQPFLTSWAAGQFSDMLQKSGGHRAQVECHSRSGCSMSPVHITASFDERQLAQGLLLRDTMGLTTWTWRAGGPVEEQLGGRQSGCGMFYIRISQPALLTSLLPLKLQNNT